MNAINWFEIPVVKMERAVKFYEHMLGETLKQETSSAMPMAIFPFDEKEKNAVVGALVFDEKRKPSEGGSVVYLNATGKIDEYITRAKKAGGGIMLPKTDIGENGFIALISDSEGNCVGLHSPR